MNCTGCGFDASMDFAFCPRCGRALDTACPGALAVAEEVGEPQLLFPCYDGLATLHLDLDDVTGAETYMRKAREICERAGVETDSLTVLPFLA